MIYITLRNVVSLDEVIPKCHLFSEGIFNYSIVIIHVVTDRVRWGSLLPYYREEFRLLWCWVPGKYSQNINKNFHLLICQFIDNKESNANST